MNPEYYGLVEVAFSFALVVIFGIWQLRSLEKAKKRTREKAASEARRNG